MTNLRYTSYSVFGGVIPRLKLLGIGSDGLGNYDFIVSTNIDSFFFLGGNRFHPSKTYVVYTQVQK